MGYQVKDVVFSIAGGQSVTLPMTVAGPIPAENDTYKIEVAGFSVGPSKEKSSETQLTWGFALSAKKSVNLKQVLVEQVSPGDVEKKMLKDTSASLKNGMWRGSAEPVPLNENETPWLYESGSSTFIFKITIQAEGQNDVVLYQPSTFPQQSKEIFRNMAAKNKG